MNGYRKSTTLGDRDCITISPRKAYVRESNLTADWRRCRVGFFFSLVGAGGDNGDCVAESIPLLTEADQFGVGISNGVGYIGAAGNQFVGLGRTDSPIRSYWYAGTSYWDPMYYASHAAIAGNSGAVTKSGISSTVSPVHGPPSAASRFCGFLCIDITLNSANTAFIQCGSNGSGTPYGVITDVGINELRAAMYAASVSGGSTVGGGWWGTGPSGIRHLYIRAPYYLNALRIHAADVIQLG